MGETNTPRIGRRSYLRAVGMGGATILTSTGLGSAAHQETATVTFPDQDVIRPTDQSRGPFQAAVEVRDLTLPDGGWVVISTDPDDPLGTLKGRTTHRLGPGHWKRFLNQVEDMDSGTRELWASLYGEGGGAGEDFPGAPYNVQDAADVTF